ncbi:MAG: PfkB family carbohydrate kinase [Chloroflexota bacterium]
MNELTGSHGSIDYLVIGHISVDITPSGQKAGGTVVYSARTARALGCRTAVLTSTSPDYDLEGTFPGILVHNSPSKRPTMFENVYSAAGRQQKIHSVANSLYMEDVPDEWQRAAIVHLGPIANEIDPGMIKLFSNSLVGITPQGWFRQWNGNGQVQARDWPEAKEVLPYSAAVILSMEDIPERGTLDQIRQLSPLVVLTQQAGGCTVYFRDESRHIPAYPAQEVNPTGAGDIFAASFLVRLYQTKGNAWEAAAFANRLAACSVAYDGLEAKFKAIKELLESGV